MGQPNSAYDLTAKIIKHMGRDRFSKIAFVVNSSIQLDILNHLNAQMWTALEALDKPDD